MQFCGKAQLFFMSYQHKTSPAHLLTLAASAFTNAINRKFREQHFEVTFEMWLLLNSLWAKDGQSQNELAKDCYRDKSGITRLTDNLIERNLVVRIADKTDKRSNMIYLTKAGKDLKQPLTTCVEQIINTAKTGFSEEEWLVSGKVLEKIFKNLAG